MLFQVAQDLVLAPRLRNTGGKVTLSPEEVRLLTGWKELCAVLTRLCPLHRGDEQAWVMIRFM